METRITMDNPGSAILFPAFVPEFTGKEQQAIHHDDFREMLAHASQILRTDLTAFDFHDNTFLEDEERSQYISYIFSCSVAEILKKKGSKPLAVSGYSMGIYAAFSYAGAISFETGLLLLQQAWRLICQAAEGEEYGMGMIVGLSEEDIREMIRDRDVILCNRNNPHTCILSGHRKGIREVLDLAREEGALRANLLPVSKPYHTPVLKKAARGFEDYLKKFVVKDPSLPIVSALDTRVLDKGGDLRQELVRNLYYPMNWLGAMKKLLGLGAEVFLECGLGDGLTRNFRFIDQKVKAISADKLDLFLGG